MTGIILTYIWIICAICNSTYGTTSPHIVFILADDLGWADVGFNNPDVITPNLDRLAGEGVTFTNAYAQPVCGPSRHALLTGRYPFRDGMQHDAMYDFQPVCSPLDLTLLPQELRNVGYATHMVGKWHMGYCHEECAPTRRGFQSFYGHVSPSISYYNHTSMFAGGYDWYENDSIAFTTNYDTYVTVDQVQRAVDILEQHDLDHDHDHDHDHPVFLYLALTAPHVPLQVPESYIEAYDDQDLDPLRQKYLAMVSALDEGVGRVIDTLERTGMMENTLVVFMSDNGGNTLCASNLPYRGGKGSVWEGGTKSPTVVYGGVLEKRAYEHDGLFHIVDWYHTLLAAAGVQDTDSLPTPVDSLNQWDMVQRGGPSQRTEVIYNLDVHPHLGPITGYAALRDSRYKLIQGSPGGAKGWALIEASCSRKGNCDIIKQSILDGTMLLYEIPDETENGLRYVHDDPGDVMLFDLTDDPYEENDLSNMLPDIIEELFLRLEFHMNDVARPLWPDPEPNSDPSLHNGTITSGWCTLGFLATERRESLAHVFRPASSSGDVSTMACPVWNTYWPAKP